VERSDGSRGLVLAEIAPGETVERLRKVTAARFEVSPELREMAV
jgi:acyl CoA:acetate/3-ketoacid CoA transferase beta subunit